MHGLRSKKACKRISMIAKIHKADGKVILAVCDSSLKGKCFEENGLQLDLKSNFYKGEEMDEKRLLEYFKVANIINLVGEKSVEVGIKAGVVDKKKIIKIKGIPHAQAVFLWE